LVAAKRNNGNAKAVNRATHEEYSVDFHLQVDRRKVSRPVSGTAYGHPDAKLDVEPVDVTLIPDGEYDLYPAETKDVMRVRNAGGRWALE
jgi:hypothetical protein